MSLYYPTETNAVQKTLDAALLAGATTAVTLNNVTNIQNKPGVFVVDRVDANGTATPSKREYVAYTAVSGSTLTGLTRNADGGGSDQDHSVGAIVEFVSDVLQQQAILDGLLETVDTDGALDTTKVVDLTTAQTLTNKTLTSPTLQGNIDGWIAATDTWTYASATTFTIAGVDRTAMFPKGTKLKLTQGTVKYFYVVGSAFSTNTTITVTGGSTYTLANAAITSPYYSYASTPQGFPPFLAYTPTWNNVTIGSATVFAQFTMIGKLVWVKLSAVFAANTSISGTIGFSLPITGDTDISNNIMIGTNYAENAGTAGYCGFIRQGSTTLANPTLYSGSFYNATVPFTWGNGDFFKCVFTYEAA